MRLQKLTTDETTKYIIISAGKDGIFDTEDDLKSKPIIDYKEIPQEPTEAAVSF